MIKCIQTNRLRTDRITPNPRATECLSLPIRRSILKKIASDPVPPIARTNRYGQPCRLLFTLMCFPRLQKCFGTQPLVIPETAIVTQSSPLEICEFPLAALRSSLIGVVRIESSSSPFEMRCSLVNSVAVVVVNSVYQHPSNVWCYGPHGSCTSDT